MFLKRNRARLAGKTYEPILLVQGKRVPARRPAGHPRADSAPPKSVVVYETLANLSRLPAKLIEVIDAFCKDRQANLGPVLAASASRAESSGGDEDLEMGPCYGVLAGLHGLARELGIVTAVGETTRTQRLALYLIYARLMVKKSRLAAARASEAVRTRNARNEPRHEVPNVEPQRPSRSRFLRAVGSCESHLPPGQRWDLQASGGLGHPAQFCGSLPSGAELQMGRQRRR